MLARCFTQKNIQSIEKVQRRAARFVKKCNQVHTGYRHKFTRGFKMAIIGTDKETNKINKLVQDRKWHPGSYPKQDITTYLNL